MVAPLFNYMYYGSDSVAAATGNLAEFHIFQLSAQLMRRAAAEYQRYAIPVRLLLQGVRYAVADIVVQYYHQFCATGNHALGKS